MPADQLPRMYTPHSLPVHVCRQRLLGLSTSSTHCAHWNTQVIARIATDRQTDVQRNRPTTWSRGLNTLNCVLSVLIAIYSGCPITRLLWSCPHNRHWHVHEDPQFTRSTRHSLFRSTASSTVDPSPQWFSRILDSAAAISQRVIDDRRRSVLNVAFSRRK